MLCILLIRYHGCILAGLIAWRIAARLALNRRIATAHERITVYSRLIARRALAVDVFILVIGTSAAAHLRFFLMELAIL
jgi:hypothetical protein